MAEELDELKWLNKVMPDYASTQSIQNQYDMNWEKSTTPLLLTLWIAYAAQLLTQEGYETFQRMVRIQSFDRVPPTWAIERYLAKWFLQGNNRYMVSEAPNLVLKHSMFTDRGNAFVQYFLPKLTTVCNSFKLMTRVSNEGEEQIRLLAIYGLKKYAGVMTTKFQLFKVV